jgi:hypothetical protein
VNKSPLVGWWKFSFCDTLSILSYLLSVFVQLFLITPLNVTLQTGHRFRIIIDVMKFSTKITRSQALLRTSLNCRWFHISPGLILAAFQKHKCFNWPWIICFSPNPIFEFTCVPHLFTLWTWYVHFTKNCMREL